MIISTGMRTDIPAFYSQWFLNRIKDGFVYVRNPYYHNQVTKYLLTPEVVDCICFCTKNPSPLISHLDELNKFKQFWFVTISACGGSDSSDNSSDSSGSGGDESISNYITRTTMPETSDWAYVGLSVPESMGWASNASRTIQTSVVKTTNSANDDVKGVYTVISNANTNDFNVVKMRIQNAVRTFDADFTLVEDTDGFAVYGRDYDIYNAVIGEYTTSSVTYEIFIVFTDEGFSAGTENIPADTIILNVNEKITSSGGGSDPGGSDPGGSGTGDTTSYIICTTWSRPGTYTGTNNKVIVIASDGSVVFKGATEAEDVSSNIYYTLNEARTWYFKVGNDYVEFTPDAAIAYVFSYNSVTYVAANTNGYVYLFDSSDYEGFYEKSLTTNPITITADGKFRFGGSVYYLYEKENRFYVYVYGYHEISFETDASNNVTTVVFDGDRFNKTVAWETLTDSTILSNLAGTYSYESGSPIDSYIINTDGTMTYYVEGIISFSRTIYTRVVNDTRQFSMYLQGTYDVLSNKQLKKFKDNPDIYDEFKYWLFQRKNGDEESMLDYAVEDPIIINGLTAYDYLLT